MSESVTFRVDKELKEKLEKYKDRLNWDEEVKKFLERKIKELEAEDEYYNSVSYKNALILRSDKRAIEAFEAGKYVLACNGEYVGAFDTEQEAIEYVRQNGYKECMISHKSIRKYLEEIGELV